MDEPCLLTDCKQDIRAANAQASNLLARGEQLVGMSLPLLLQRRAPNQLASVSEILSPLPEEAGEATVPIRLLLDDTAVRVNWAVRPVDGRFGSSFRLHRFFRQQEEEEDVAQVQFLANVSHELRTPLSALVATTELMLQDYHTIPSIELGQMIGLLHRNTRRLESLVSNLIDAAGLQNGKLQLRKSATTVESLVRDAADFVQPLLKSKNQRLEHKVLGTPPVLVIDAKRIVGVLVNLFSNASRYGLPNEPIQLLVSVEGTLVRFTVRQKGSGIPKHEQALLFQRFYRGSTGETQSGGSGLGLAIVKDIVELHGGTVGVMSKPGKTTAFWFTLPLIGATT